jgi:hypothetical protein
MGGLNPECRPHEKNVLPGGGGTRLEFQHLGGRGRRISEFEASLVYTVSSRTARAIRRNPVLEKKKKKEVLACRYFFQFLYSLNFHLSALLLKGED